MKKILQPNNISAFLDEAHLEITPAQFKLTGFYNEEILAAKDPLSSFGDIDLPGTIFDDHLDGGKGTSGAVISSRQFGIDLDGFLVNVHDYDIYNNPNLFDNTGTDVVHARASKEFSQKLWKLTAGANFFMERNLWWLDFTALVGSTPSNTGIDRLDEYLDKSGDTSDWFEFEDKVYHFGIDLTLHLLDGKLLPQFEYLWGVGKQGFVTSNRSGLDFGNGPIDVPIYERDFRTIHGAIECTIVDNVLLNAEHTRRELIHPNDNENLLTPVFLEDIDANKHIFFLAGSGPETATSDYSELELRWRWNQVSAVLWLQRSMEEFHYPENNEDAYLYNFSVSPGLSAKPHPRLELELEQQYTKLDAPKPVWKGSSIETIVRGSLELTKKVSGILDARLIYIDDDRVNETDSYIAPFAGFSYDPMKKVSVVLAYGVDPLDFGIDYKGRHIGRYLFRQQYLWANPEATWKEAEKALADKRILSLRAIYNF